MNFVPQLGAKLGSCWLPVLLAFLFLVLGTTPASGQEEPSDPLAGLDPLWLTPDVSLNIEKQPLGTDMVRITMRDPDYPPELLRSQAEALAASFNSTPLGLSIQIHTIDGRDDLRFVRASFAVPGIIDRQNGILNLEPVVQAFLAGPETHRIQTFLITFVNELPTPQMVQSVRNDSVTVIGNVSEFPPGLEFRILAHTQEPTELRIPSYAEEEGEEHLAEAPGNDVPWLAILVVVGVGLAGGLLVYSRLTRVPAKKPAGRTPRPHGTTRRPKR